MYLLFKMYWPWDCRMSVEGVSFSFVLLDSGAISEAAFWVAWHQPGEAICAAAVCEGVRGQSQHAGPHLCQRVPWQRIVPSRGLCPCSGTDQVSECISVCGKVGTWVTAKYGWLRLKLIFEMSTDIYWFEKFPKIWGTCVTSLVVIL